MTSTTPAPTILLDTALGLATVKKHGPLLQLWLLIRAADGAPEGHGDGKVLVTEVETAWQRTGHSSAYLRGLLSKGVRAGWWHVAPNPTGPGKAIWYADAPRVCAALGENPRARLVPIPLTAVYGPLKSFRAAVYTRCFYGGERPVTVSRSTVQRVTGLSRPTQRAYEDATHTQRQPNAWVTPWTRYDEFPGGVLGAGWENPVAHGWFYHAPTGTMARKLPNSYQVVDCRRQKRRGHGAHRCQRPVENRAPRRYFYDVHDLVSTPDRRRAEVHWLRQAPGEVWAWQVIDNRRPGALFCAPL